MKKPLYKFEFALTPDQVKYMKPLIDAFEELVKIERPGAILAQILPEGEYDKALEKRISLPKVTCYIVPRYKMKMLLRVLHKKPSGKLRRRDYFKAAKKQIKRITDY